MTSEIRFDGRVAIVTGAGAGLGREHALALAARGGRVVVNDFGGHVDGSGFSSGPAEETVELIRRAGGDAFSHCADVTKMDQVQDMVAQAKARWGRVDILVNNAGILRDRSFSKMTESEFETVVAVHLFGSANSTMAVWPLMREANYGRIAMTSSSSGVFGNFGQSNYAAAKMAVIGLMNSLHIEGAKHNIRVNTLSPGATTRMTEGLLSPQVASLMDAKAVTPGLLYLVSDEAPSRTILAAGAGGFARVLVSQTEGVWLAPEERTPEEVARRFEEISDPSGQHYYESGAGEVMKFVGKASAAAGVDLA